MEERLKMGFTLVFNGEYDNISGGYLKKGERGMIPMPLRGDEVDTLELFPSVLDTLLEGKILQLYSYDDDIIAMIGSRCYEGPYAEKEYLNVENNVKNSSVISALKELNLQLSESDVKEDVKTYRKAYKLYGSDKYKLEEDK